MTFLFAAPALVAASNSQSVGQTAGATRTQSGHPLRLPRITE